jgi:hypothetical protein
VGSGTPQPVQNLAGPLAWRPHLVQKLISVPRYALTASCMG